MTLNQEDYFKRMITRRSYEEVLEKAKKILCIQPHADDADFGAGGTIAKLTRKGCEVVYVTLTDDRVGTFKQDLWPEKLAIIRVKEQERAAEILGVKRLIWLNYRDSELYPSLELRGKLIRLIREIRPDVVMTNDPWLLYEAHPDHRYTGLMAAEAVLFSPFPHVNPEHIREGLNLRDFQKMFGVRFDKMFKREMKELEKLNRLQIKGNIIRLRAGNDYEVKEDADFRTYSRFFYSPRVMEKIKEKYDQF